MNKKIIFIFLTLSALVSGCAPLISGAMNATLDENTIYEKTANYFNVDRKTIEIFSIKNDVLSTTYRTRYAGRIFNCSIYYGAVDCNQPGGADISTKPAIEKSPLAASEIIENPVMSPIQAQNKLNQLGFSVGKPDGIFGKKSVEKLKLFQKSKELAVTGKLDAPTIEALR